jgi:hypothetical protein
MRNILARRACIVSGAASLVLTIASGTIAPGTPAVAARLTARPYTVWHSVFLAGLRRSNALASVESTGPNDAWAVGNGQTSGGYAVHWNGHRWRVVDLPDPKFTTSTVRASAPDNVWVTGLSSAASRAYRWDGQRWNVLVLPANTGGLGQDPVVLGPSDVWLSGMSTWTPHGWNSVAWHWNGSGWVGYHFPISTAYPSFIAGSSGRNLWVLGTRTRSNAPHAVGRLVAYRWTGSSWHLMPVPRVRMTGPPYVAVAHSGEVWVLGTGTTRAHRAYLPILLRRRAGHWARLGTSGLYGLGTPTPDGLNGVWFDSFIYWSGRSWHLAAPSRRLVPGCAHGISSTGFFDFAGIPGTHRAYFVGACLPGNIHGKLQGVIFVSRPR